jgi:hypothetical protein
MVASRCIVREFALLVTGLSRSLYAMGLSYHSAASACYFLDARLVYNMPF